MTKKDNQQSNQDKKQYNIPMEVTEETIRDLGIDRSKVGFTKIGNKKVRAIMLPATEEQYKGCMRPLWNEDKYQQRHTKYILSLDQLYEQTNYEFGDMYADAESDVLTHERIKALRKALAQLNELDRTIMEMFGDGMSEAKIGKVVGMSQRGVGKRKQKAILKLRELLKDWF